MEKKTDNEKVENKNVPKYSFADVPDGTLIPASPIKKTIAKTMEVTENFNIFDVMTYIAKLKKAIADKDAEKEGMVHMLKAYEDELEFIEKELGVQKMEEEYQREVAEKASVRNGIETLNEIINEENNSGN